MKQTRPAAGRLSRHDSRPAVATMWMLVVLSVLTVLMAVITWQVLANRRWLDRRQNQMQAIWLARSGLELAATRLLSNPAGYTGEFLQLIPESGIRIEVQRDSDSANSYSVTSEARYPTSGKAVVVRLLTRRLRRVTEKDGVRVEVVAAAAQ
jgi:type II secretory pathway pseudopilin PulG